MTDTKPQAMFTAFNLNSSGDLSLADWFRLKLKPMKKSRDEFSGLILYYKELNGCLYLIKSEENRCAPPTE